MDYDKIIGDLNEIINSEFTMLSLFEIQKIYIFLCRVYRRELMKKDSNRKACEETYEQYFEYVNDVVWNKLKEELDFEDEVINRIFAFVRIMDKIDEIYVLDGNVIVKGNDKSGKKTIVSPNLHFTDITAQSFIHDNENNIDSNYVVMSINNSIRPLIQNRPTPDDVVVLNDGKINYEIDNINIYTSHNISDILSDNKGMKVTKVLVTYFDKVFYFDMKRRDNYIILIQDDYKVHTLSEIFNENRTKKTK